MPARGARPTAFAPSGEQIVIEAGDQRLVVVEVGGGIRSFSVGGYAILDGYGVDEMSQSARGHVLLPWPNRIRDGSYEYGGRRHQLALSEPEQSNAIHGLVRWSGWTVRARQADRVVMGHRLHPQQGYPFALDLSIDYSLSVDGLAVRTTATNVGPGTCPFGAGAHPWLHPGGTTVDPATLTVPAGSVFRSDGLGIPTEMVRVDVTELDFRMARPIGSVRMDHAFTGLVRDADGRARVVLERVDGIAVEVWVDRAYPYLMVTTGDVLPDVNRRSIAVEPMTCPPNAFATGEAIIELAPGETFQGNWGIAATLPHSPSTDR